jgi:PKD repeat protein
VKRTPQPPPLTLQRLAALLFILIACVLAACRQDALPVTSLNATPATAQVGAPVRLSWESAGGVACTLFTGQRALTLETCAGGEVEERYRAPGSYRPRLEVADARGARAEAETTVTVSSAETPEALSFRVEQDGLSVTFRALGAPPQARLSWTFGDGAQATGAEVSHRYRAPGTYEVTLRATHLAGEETSRRTVVVAPERVTLFSGGDLSAWRLERGGASNWRTQADYLEVNPGRRVGDHNLQTVREFGDFRLHLEFWVPASPKGTPEQARGNSGVYLQGRYEVQILDSYGRTLGGQNDAGAIYGVRDAAHNASLPPETWQRYEIVFRAARFSGGRKTENARVTLFWNGQKVHDRVQLPGPTLLGDPEQGEEGVLTGPVRLQDHGDRVRFRNIWLEPL